MNFQVFDSLPSPGSLSDALADKLRMSRTSLAEVNTILILMITMLMLLDPSSYWARRGLWPSVYSGFDTCYLLSLTYLQTY